MARSTRSRKPTLVAPLNSVIDVEFERVKDVIRHASEAVFTSGIAGVATDCAGLAKFHISSQSFRALRDLFDDIVIRVKKKNNGRLAEWNGEEDYDLRGRCYAFLNGGIERLNQKEIMFHMAEKSGSDASMDKERNIKCSLEFGGPEGPVLKRRHFKALEEISTLITPLVEEKYRRFVTLDNLIALQPNVHNGKVSPYLFLRPRWDAVVELGINLLRVRPNFTMDHRTTCCFIWTSPNTRASGW